MKDKLSIKPNSMNVLTINSGSSSIKFALYSSDGSWERILNGKVDRIGITDTCLHFNNLKKNKKGNLKIEVSDHKSVAKFLIDWLEKQVDFSSISAIGHRVVYGMKHSIPELITSGLLKELSLITSYDLDHLPAEIELIKVFRQHHPKHTQIACFDTAFHQTMPRVATLLPIPRRFDAKGIQRYGFHGLSYAYLMEELTRIATHEATQGRIILAHLGSGASMAAVYKGKSIDTSMGFTPAGGLIMGTRSGDLDPGVAWFMMKSEKLSPKQFDTLINHDSGLLGVSETSSDMKDLLESQKTDIRAAEAIELFCYQAKKWIGAFTAALGGLDTLVFSGGMGENAPEIRSRICEGLEYLGVDIDKKQNQTNAPIISINKCKTTVRVIHTDEEWMIAKTVSQMINNT
jgi:acetate kinase